MISTTPKPLKLRLTDTKYTGTEPQWPDTVTPEARATLMIKAFAWYAYHCGKKEVKQFMLDWLAREGRAQQARDLARVPESSLSTQAGWLCRMNVMGLILTESEQHYLDSTISQHLERPAEAAATETAQPIAVRPNIQDRLRERMTEAAGELEGLYDDLIRNGARLTADSKPMAVLRGLNVAPQLIGDILAGWQARAAELQEVLTGRDGGLVEGYSNFSRAQLKNLVKFAELVIADCGSYVQVKKTERTPRRRKPVSPERLTQRFRFLREFAELGLKSEPVTRLVGSQEIWMYDTKKRKLIYVVADNHIGTMTVKGVGLVGFDTTNSVQKTLRRPAEQIKALLTGGVANTRKYFKDIRTTATKFNGRSNENLVILKVR